MELERKCSPATLSAYSTDLRFFTTFLTGLDPNFDFSKVFSWRRVTSKTVDRYELWLQNQKFKLSTINRKLAVLRSFYNYLIAEGLLRFNPTRERIINYQPQQFSEVLSEETVEKVLEQIRTLQHKEVARDLALFTLIYSTGIRTSELVSLGLNDIRVNNGQMYLVCHGRNGTERIVALEDSVRDCLNDYLENKRPKLLNKPAEEALFLSRQGRRLTRAGVWLILGKHAKAAGFEKKVTARILRHTFTARMLASGKCLEEVRILLGLTNSASYRLYKIVSKNM